MKSYIKLFAGAIIICQFFSCSNDLTENVFSSVTEQSYEYTSKDFYPVVASVYPPLRGYLNITNFFVTQEVTADAIVMPPNPSG